MNDSRFNSEGNDLKRLLHFLTEVEEFLSELVGKKEYEKLFYYELLTPMRSAWKEIPLYFELAKSKLSHFDSKALKRHGLTGRQLDFKLDVIDFMWNKFISIGLPKWAKRLLKAINNLLNSILSGIPAGSAISEMKNGVESALKDVDS